MFGVCQNLVKTAFIQVGELLLHEVLARGSLAVVGFVWLQPHGRRLDHTRLYSPVYGRVESQVLVTSILSFSHTLARQGHPAEGQNVFIQVGALLPYELLARCALTDVCRALGVRRSV